MSGKQPLNIELNAEEREALDELAKEKDLSRVVVIRQALRLYQFIWRETKAGGSVVIQGGTIEKHIELL